MGKYSSDSDSSRGDRRNRKSKRSRSSSSSSSTSLSYSKNSHKCKHSRERPRPPSKSRNTTRSKQHLNSDNGSRTNLSGKNQRNKTRTSRSKSREGVPSKSHERSSKHSRSRSSSKQRSLTHSKDRSKSSSPEEFSHDSPNSRPGLVKQEPSTEEQLQAKLHRAMKAAQSADNQLRQQGLLTSGSLLRKEVTVSTLPVPLDSILDEINDTTFSPKHFTSSKTTSQVLPEQSTANLLTPLDTNNLKLISLLQEPGCIFHSRLLVDPGQKFNKWIKKLFHLRQKAINGEPLA